MVKQFLAIRRAEGIAQIVVNGSVTSSRALGEAQRLLAGELGLVGEYGGHHAAKAFADALFIALVGDLDKALDRRWSSVFR